MTKIKMSNPNKENKPENFEDPGRWMKFMRDSNASEAIDFKKFLKQQESNPLKINSLNFMDFFMNMAKCDDLK